jgi:hypothetical protein
LLKASLIGLKPSEYGGANLGGRSGREMLIIHFLENEAFARCSFQRRAHLDKPAQTPGGIDIGSLE